VPARPRSRRSVKPKLSADDIDLIVDLLTSWRGRLTWELLEDRVIVVLGRPYSRQALDAHENISRAFKAAKKRSREYSRANRHRGLDPDDDEISAREAISLKRELAIALARIDSLTAKLVLLEQERNALLQTFATWLYNARNRRMTENDLNQPLPNVERDRTA
jgi:hypothetical protein